MVTNINPDVRRGKTVTFFHPQTHVLVRGTVIRQATFGDWWVQTDDGMGWLVGASELFWQAISAAAKAEKSLVLA